VKLHYELFRKNNTSLSSCIGEYKVVPKELCDELIEWFEQSKTVRVDDHRKQSNELQIIGDPRPEAVEYKHTLFDYLYPLGEKYEMDMYSLCHSDYIPEDIPMTRAFNTGFRSLQIQKYTPEDKGYPAVHIESGPEHIKKYLAVIVYLNTIDSDYAGETVFPMCGKAIEPEAGLAVVFPTGIPFYHCGRPSKKDKYIITSWFEFM
tara:strand:- start:772 stop:1386 length:615 start_codon:yes stop_codon:yes gene_type:complete